MKIIKLLLLSLALVFIGQVHAGAWDELKPYEITDNTPIVFSPKDNTLVLEDPTGTLTVGEVLKRKDEFKPPSEMASLDARHHYWIMQKIASKLNEDRRYRLDGFWQKLNTHVIASDDVVFTLKPAGFADGKYAFLSEIDPALPSSAKVPSREALFTLRSGEGLSLLSHTKALSGIPPRSFVLSFVDNERFLESRRFGLYVEGVLLGILLALAIFGWYSYVANKDRAGLFYSLWILFAFLSVFNLGSPDGVHLTEFALNIHGTYIGVLSLALFLSNFLNYGQTVFYFLFSSAFYKLQNTLQKLKI